MISTFGVMFVSKPGGQTSWDLFSTGYGPTKTLASTRDPQLMETLRNDFIAYHDGFRTELGVSMPREYLVTIGIRKS